jgi:hypothetical protein
MNKPIYLFIYFSMGVSFLSSNNICWMNLLTKLEYHSTLATLIQIILIVEMLNFLKKSKIVILKKLIIIYL